MSTPEKVAGKGQAARNAAVKRLIDEFSERFEQIHSEERHARGLLLARPKQPTKADLQAELDRMRELLERNGINADRA